MAQSPPFNIAETVPADADFVRNFPAAERLFRDIIESWMNVEHDSVTGRHSFDAFDTATLSGITYAVGSIRYDTDVHSLQINIPTLGWVNVGVPAGTRQIFVQEDAPLGWTKITDVEVDEAIIELTTGSVGGDYEGSTALRDATISQAMLPSVNFSVSATAAAGGDHSHGGNTGSQSNDHTHGFSATTSSDGAHTHSTTFDNDSTGAGIPAFADDGNTEAISRTTSSDGAHTHSVSGTTGGISLGHTHSIAASGTHTHSVSGTAASGGSGSAYAASVKRIRAILCEKD